MYLGSYKARSPFKLSVITILYGYVFYDSGAVAAGGFTDLGFALSTAGLHSPDQNENAEKLGQARSS